MDVETLRMVERLVVVLGGVLSVFLGYKLFFVVNEKSDSAADIKLGDLVDVGLKKVAPGVFFALFGAWILGTSLTSKIESNRSTNTINGDLGKTIATINNLIEELPTKNREKIKEQFTILQIQLPKSPIGFFGNTQTPQILPNEIQG
jgi:hypothetical protein